MRFSSSHVPVLLLAAAGLALAAGCGTRTAGHDSMPAGLGAPETFRWGDQPIAFATPPDDWRREGYGDGGTRGIRFVKERSVGEAVIVAEVYRLGERDRGRALREILSRLDAYDERDLRHALSLARWRTDEPFAGNEGEVASAVNYAIDRANTGMIHADRGEVRMALMEANDAAGRLKVGLDDVVASVTFQPERRAEPWRYQVTARDRILIGGEPADRVDYTLKTDERVLVCRELHFVHGNRLFVASFQGLKKNLGLFDRLAGSITFPPHEATRP